MRTSHNLFVVRLSTRFLLFAACGFLFLPIQWLLGFVVAVSVHELSHYAAILLSGAQVQAVEIGDSGIQIQTGRLSCKQELICSIAGPVGGLVLAFLARKTPEIFVCAFVQSLFNLLPLETLDGGRMLKCLLSKLRHRELILQFSDITVRIALSALLLYIAIISFHIWLCFLSILIVCRLWRQKYLANKENQ